jgi:DNA polymerase III delta prime subunit
MKRSLLLLFVIVTAVLIKSEELRTRHQASQQEIVDQLKKEINSLKKTINEAKLIAVK